MKDILTILICTLPSIACAVGAIILALNGIGGWGWFLTISLFSNPIVLGIKVQ